MQAEWLAIVALGAAAETLARPDRMAREPRPTPLPQSASLQLVTLIKEGRSHVLEVREGFFDVRRKGTDRPLYRAYTRELADIYFRDVEANRARELRFESWS